MKIAIRASLAVALLTSGLLGQLAMRKTLTLAAAKKIAAAAAAEAVKNQWNVVIAILDDGGHLLYLERMDGTQIGSIEVALGKAATAVRFKRPSKALEDSLAGGRQAILGLPGVVPVEGGIPLMIDGRIAGSIGVSGVLSPQDSQIAAAGAAEFAKMQ